MILVNPTGVPVLLPPVMGMTILIPPKSGGSWETRSKIQKDEDRHGNVIAERVTGQEIVQISVEPVGVNYVDIPDAYRAAVRRQAFQQAMKKAGIIEGESIVQQQEARLQELEKRLKAQGAAQESAEMAKLKARAEQAEDVAIKQQAMLEDMAKRLAALEPKPESKAEPKPAEPEKPKATSGRK